MITYLRTGRSIRGTGSAIWKSPDGVIKIKPARDGWGCILVTPEEIEAGKEKPAIRHREKLETPAEKPKRERKPKPAPLPRWKELVERVRLFELDHVPDGWPGVQMRFLSELADELEAAQTIFQAKP
ncbi:MAG: hypothetical protein RLZZ214_1100 [Verrucomicrobiota bacterium]|jgi:hypothetical protein